MISTLTHHARCETAFDSKSSRALFSADIRRWFSPLFSFYAIPPDFRWFDIPMPLIFFDAFQRAPGCLRFHVFG
jgi:hypothetical protein